MHTRSTTVWPFLNNLYLASICHRMISNDTLETCKAAAYFEKLESRPAFQPLNSCFPRIRVSALSVLPSRRRGRQPRIGNEEGSRGIDLGRVPDATEVIRGAWR